MACSLTRMSRILSSCDLRSSGRTGRSGLSDVNISPSMIEHEQSLWDVISETISGTIRDLHSRGAISYPPIFIFVVNKGENLDFAKNGESALASNRYFLYSLAQNRRLIFCADSVWDDYSRSDWTSGPYEMDLIFPYRLFNDNVINYFMQIPRKRYQSGGLASDLFVLYKSGANQSDSSIDTVVNAVNECVPICWEDADASDCKNQLPAPTGLSLESEW